MELTRSGPVGAEAALACLMRGELAQGLSLYRDALGGDNLSAVPAGLHVSFLDQAGRSTEAAALRSIALAAGANLAVRAGSIGASASEAASEYEALFADDIVNSRMIYEYLKILACLGRMAEHRRLLDPDRLFRLAEAPADDQLARSVDHLLLELEPQAMLKESTQSVRNMAMIPGWSDLDHPVAQALTSEIEAQATGYLRAWRESDHPFAKAVPTSVAVRAWGLISRGDGYNIPHVHSKGWATGIYYPRSIDVDGGDLVIGKPASGAGSDQDWAARRVRPIAGLLVLFPSFYTHWTEPLGQPGLRTSVAFDLIDVQAG